MKLTKGDKKTIGILFQNKPWLLALIIKQWNAETPHFGGDMPHRYDGKSRRCSYCERPKNWKPRNVFYTEEYK